MANEIDIVVRDSINAKIRRKILNIARASDIAQSKIENLKKSLNFRGLNLGLRNTGIANLDTALSKVQIQFGKTAEAAAKSATAQENALNKMIALEERAAQAAERRASAARRNAQSEQQAATRTASVIEQQNQRVRQSQEARFNANNAGLARTRAAEQRARAAEERRLSASRRDHQRTENLKRTLAERFKATQASVAASVQASNNRVITSTNNVIVKEQALVAALDRSSVGYQKMAKAGLAAEAAQNRVTAAQTRLAGPTRVVARNTTNLSRKQVRAAISANKLSISNDKAAKSAIDLRLAELRLASALDRAAGAANRNNAAMARTGRSIGAVSGRFQGFRQNVIGFIRDIRSLAAFAIIFGAARGLTNAIDGYDNLQNKLKNVTSSQKELNKVTNEIFDIAKRARVPVGDLAKSFVRFDLALKSLGRSQQESLQLTETVSKLLTLNGNSAEESAAALLQLSQAFSKGKLDGDEFRSVMELMPQTFQEGLIKTLGITRKELFDFSKDGKITAEVLAKTFASIAPEVEKAFAGLEKTLGQQLTNLGTELTRAFGELNKQIGITRKLGNAIEFVTENIDKFVIALKALGALAAVYVGFKTATASANLLGTAITKLATAVTLLVRGGNLLTGSLLFRDKQLGDRLAKAFGSFKTLGRITIPGAVIGALATLVGLVVVFSDKIKLSTDSVTTLADWLNALGNRIQNVYGQLVGDIDLSPQLARIKQAFDSTFDSVRSAVGTAFNFIIDLGDAIFATISGAISAWNRFSELTRNDTIGNTLLRGARVFGAALLEAVRPLIILLNREFAKISNGISNTIRTTLNPFASEVELTAKDFKAIEDSVNSTINDLQGTDFGELTKAFGEGFDFAANLAPVRTFFDGIRTDADKLAQDRISAERKVVAEQLKAEQEKLELIRRTNQEKVDAANRNVPALVSAERTLQEQLRNARQGVLTQEQQAAAQIRALRLQDQQQQIQEELTKAQQVLQAKQTTEQQKTQIEQTSSLLRQQLASLEAQHKIVEEQRKLNNVSQIEQQITQNQQQQENLRRQSTSSSVNLIIQEFNRLQSQFNSTGQQMTGNWQTVWSTIQNITQNVVNVILNLISRVSSAISGMLSRLGSLGGAIQANGGQIAGTLLGGSTGGAIGTGVQSLLGSFGGGAGAGVQNTAGFDQSVEQFDNLSQSVSGLTSGLSGLTTEFDNAAGASDRVNTSARSWLADNSLTNRLGEYGLGLNDFENGATNVGLGLDKMSASGNNASSSADQLANSVNNANSSLGSQGGHASNASSGLDRYASSANNAASASNNLANSGKNGFGGLTNSVNNFASNSQSALGSVFSNVQQSLSNFVRTGKFDFKELLRSIVDDMLRLVTSKLFGQFMQGISGGGASAGGGGLLSGIFGGGGGGLFGGGGGLFGGGFLGGGLLGFATGGLVPAGERVIRVNERGQETVMNAQATRKYGNVLNAMNRGRSITPVGNGGGTIKQNIVINNNASNTDVEARQNENGDLEVIVRRIADERINTRVPRLVASNVQNPNSRVSKAIGQSTSAQRRRS